MRGNSQPHGSKYGCKPGVRVKKVQSIGFFFFFFFSARGDTAPSWPAEEGLQGQPGASLQSRLFLISEELGRAWSLFFKLKW